MSSGPLFTGIRRLPVWAAALALTSSPLAAQQDSILSAEAYLAPPGEIARVVAAPRHENVTLGNPSPSGRVFLNPLGGGLASLADFARPHHNLGGVQIDPAASRARQLTTRALEGFELISWEDGRKVRVQVPAGARVSSPAWSPDGARLAFFAHFDDATHVYVADATTGRSRPVTRTPVLATLVTALAWTADGERIVTVIVPEGRGPAPRTPAVPAQPMVRTTREGENKLRTYASLLQGPHEQALVEYYTTGQLAVVEVESRRVQRIGRPAMIQSVDPAPGGDYFRVTTLRKPFSYIVPVSNFATVEEIWDAGGRVLAELQKRPLREGLREERSSAADDGRRAIAWRPDGAGLGFLQLEPAPPKAEGAEQADTTEARGKRKDRVLQWLPPFDSASLRVVYESEERIGGVQYSDDARTLFLTETARGSTHLYAVSLDEPATRHTIFRKKTDEFYADPGELMTTTGTRGGTVVRLSGDGRSVFLSGTTYSKKPLEEAPRPFIDRVEIRTGARERVFESAADLYERVTAVLDPDFERVVISRESPTLVPDSWLRTRSTGEIRKLTANTDHAPEITAAQRRTIEVTRVDGVNFWVHLTLPAGYAPGTRLPALFWFYPREYTDQADYDRSNRTHNKNRFPSVGPRSMEILTRLGYAVVQPDAPIIGPAGRMNDNYVPDLRNNLSATIDALDRLGYIDRDRLGLGGHSYGAFSTVNAMVHTPFFKAGIAGDGNFNRTLTPIGFQSERRELWEARERYLEMSPFLWAERLNGALLMYHGMDDQNVGTDPVNSQRLFHALNGLGKTAALYMYPYEDHGPATRETLLDMWARWIAWLDRYVKNAAPAPAAVTAEAGGS